MKRVSTDRILTFLEGHRPAMVSLLKELVMIESPTSSPELQTPIFQLISQQMKGIGYSVCRMPGKETGGYLISHPEKREKGAPIQLLVGHCDTVWPVHTIRDMPVRIRQGKMKGPGVFDMKAGITQMIFALKAIAFLGLPLALTPVLILNSDEEKGSRESTVAIHRLSRIASRAFVLEPPFGPEGKLKTERKGLGRFTLKITGVPAHAGLDPGKGVSAILELSQQVQRLFSLNDPVKGITVNVGMVEGGTQANIIAPSSSAVIELRVRTAADGDRMTRKILGLKPIHPGIRLSVTGGMGRPPMEKTIRNQRLWLAAKKAGKSLGIDLGEAAAGGGSDGNTTSQYTATLDGLGTPGDGAHARYEYILLDKLVERTALLILLITMKAL